MEEKTANMQKYENYKEQFKRLNKALDNGFNLEAIFIEYAIIEDRTESILKHAEKWDSYLKNRRNGNSTLDSKIRYIQKIAENKKDVSHKYFSDDLLSEILAWKEERNKLIHALLKQQLEHNELSGVALKGDELVKKLKLKSNNYNRALGRKNKI